MKTMNKYIFALAVMTATVMTPKAFAGVHIFYAAHPDDFVIAMGAAVREHKEAGHTVYLVLNSAHTSIGSLLDIMQGNAECPVPELHGDPDPVEPIYHNFEDMTMVELAMAEEREIISAAKILGVDKVLFYNYGRGLSDNQSFDSDPAKKEAYKQSMREMIESMEEQFGYAGHKVIANFDPDPWGFNNETHRLLAEAALDLYFEQKISDLRLYKIYAHYYHEDDPRRSPDCNDWVAPRTTSQMDYKRKALDEHFYWNPAFGRFAFAAHSVSALIDKNSPHSSYNSPVEFVMVPHDYKTWTPAPECY